MYFTEYEFSLTPEENQVAKDNSNNNNDLIISIMVLMRKTATTM